MNLLMTQYAVEGVTKENKKLRKKLAKQQQEFNNYREELANQVGEELAKQREELAKQREEFNNFRVDMAKLLEDMAKDMDELRGRLEDEGCGPPIGELSVGGDLSIGDSKQIGGGACERFHCVCGGNVKNEKRAIYAHNRQPMHTKYVSKKEE